MARKMVDRALATGPSALHTGVRSPLRPKPGDGVVGHRHPQRRIPALAQPRRQADRNGMHMCQQNAQHRQDVERVLEDFLPKRLERKSVVKGKSVSVGVDLGGRRCIKKKKKKVTKKKHYRHTFKLNT